VDVREFAKRRPALFFSLFIVLWMWIFMALVIALVPIDPVEGPQFVHVALVFLVASPTIFGFLFARIIDGKRGVRSLFARLGRWRVGLTWYAASLLLIPAVIGAATLLRGLLGADLKELDLLGNLLFAIPISLLAGVMEEFGWRGFLLPKVLEKHGALKAALLVGGVWALWHAPINYLGVSKYGAEAVPILLVLLVLPVAETVIMVWIFMRTRQSMLLMVLMHFSITCGHILLTLPTSTAGAQLEGDLITAGAFVAAAIVVVAASRTMRQASAKKEPT
jgi:membrane protease YdiL (CAAX protease family)